MPQHMSRAQKTALRSNLALSTFMWVLGSVAGLTAAFVCCTISLVL